MDSDSQVTPWNPDFTINYYADEFILPEAISVYKRDPDNNWIVNKLNPCLINHINLK